MTKCEPVKIKSRNFPATIWQELMVEYKPGGYLATMKDEPA